jgi:hypothetical protein
MKNIVFRLLVCALLAFTAVVPAFAKAKKKASPAPTPHPTLISSVSGNSITVTDDKNAKTITVTAFTEVMLNGQKATFADLKPGMRVELVLSSPTQASRITANSK